MLVDWSQWAPSVSEHLKHLSRCYPYLYLIHTYVLMIIRSTTFFGCQISFILLSFFSLAEFSVLDTQILLYKFASNFQEMHNVIMCL